MKTGSHFKLRQIVKWSLAVICLGWMLGAIWFLFLQPTPTYYGNSYNSQQAKLAKCRTLMSSEARYQCTSSLMLSRDNAIFNQALVVVLPVFGLVIGYLGVTRIYAAHRDRVRSRSAVAASRKRMAEWRSQMKAAAATQPTGPAALTPVPIPTVRPGGAIPPRPSRRQ